MDCIRLVCSSCSVNSQFQRKRVEEHERKSHYWSDHSSDEDESAKVPDALRHKYQDPFEALEAAVSDFFLYEYI